MNNFEMHENKGRAKLRRLLELSPKVELYHFTDDPYNHIDVFITGVSNCTSAIEIKDREIPSTKYDTVMIEKTKVDALTKAYEESGYTPYFLTLFNDGIAYLWNLNNLDLSEKNEKKMKCTPSCAENYQKCGVEKTVFLLNKEQAKKIKWKRSN